MVQINWSPQSISDLKTIKEYIAKHSYKYTKLQVIKLRLRPRILQEHIYAGHIVDEMEDKKYRELIEDNYRVIYKIVNSPRIDILTIHHTARDLSKKNL
jgi:toxin ParE1/3/4